MRLRDEVTDVCGEGGARCADCDMVEGGTRLSGEGIWSNKIYEIKNTIKTCRQSHG